MTDCSVNIETHDNIVTSDITNYINLVLRAPCSVVKKSYFVLDIRSERSGRVSTHATEEQKHGNTILPALPPPSRKTGDAKKETMEQVLQ